VNDSDSRLAAALDYARKGLPVLPLHSVQAGRCSCPAQDCRNVGKHPRSEHGVKEATTDAAQITAWWTRWPEANIGIATGSAVVVVDVDPRKGGDDTLRVLEDAHGRVPPTWRSQTGGGGEHIFFLLVPGLGNSAGRLGPGLDVRGIDGYIVAPPSSHASGREYVWEEEFHPDDVPLAAMPLWMIERLQGAAKSGASSEPFDWAALLQGVSEGQRHEVAAKLAGHYLGLGLKPDEVEEIVLGFGRRCTPPADPDDLRRIVRDLAQKDHAKADGRDKTDPGALAEGLGTFLQRQFSPPQPLIEGLMSDEGGGWRAGEEKLGKTFYCQHEALCLALGRPVLGRFAVPMPVRVLFIEEEDSPRRTYRRFRALLRGMGLNPDDPALQATLDAQIRLVCCKGFTLDSADMVQQLEAEIDAFRPGVVYLDVLRKLSTRDLNKAFEAGALLAILDRWRRDYGTVCLIIHHFRKTQGFRVGRGSQELGGSFVLGAWGENSCFFEPVGRKSDAVKVEIQSKDLPPVEPFRLVFESEGPRDAPTFIRLQAGDLAEKKTEQKLAETLDALRAADQVPGTDGRLGATAENVARILKKSLSQARRRLNELRDADLAETVDELPGEGGKKPAPLWAPREVGPTARAGPDPRSTTSPPPDL
jgi:hypothetical protein